MHAENGGVASFIDERNDYDGTLNVINISSLPYGYNFITKRTL